MLGTRAVWVSWKWFVTVFGVKIMRSSIDDLLVLEPEVRRDDRGFFFEAWNLADFSNTTGSTQAFVQDNHSRSSRGVLRGLHYQLEPKAQGKLVRVVRGAVWDVAVDIRRTSATFKKWFGIELTGDNHLQFWVPPGFAHGFLALTDEVDLLYKVTDYYSPELDRSLRYDDPEIGIDWPSNVEVVLSEKDARAPYLRDADIFA